MPSSEQPAFGTRSERGYDRAAVETFPWPVVAAYDDVHRWMDQGLAVHAAWQIRDSWESLIKFLGTLAVADAIQANGDGQSPQHEELLAVLLDPRGLSLGHWPKLAEIALKPGAPAGHRLSGLRDLLYKTNGKPTRLLQTIVGGEGSFITWRNRRFGHGVFQKDESVYAQEARHWLDQLHEAYDDCRALLSRLHLESEGPQGEILTWGEQLSFSFYHEHAAGLPSEVVPSVRVRLDDGAPLELSPILSVQRCGVCGQWQAFYLDRHEADKSRTWFLDFVLGHSHSRKHLAIVQGWRAQVRAAKAAATEAAELPEPELTLFRDFGHEFSPPVYLAEQVGQFLQTHDRGMVHLTGPAGVGKSWAARGLDRAEMLPAVLGRAVPVLAASVHGNQVPTAGDVKSWLAQEAKDRKRWQVPSEPDGPTPAARFAAWLAALMRANGHGELIVVLDGLDELPADSDVPDLIPPADQLPPRCYLVLTSRPEVRRAAAEGLRRAASAPACFESLAISPDTPRHREVLRNYACLRLAQRRPDDQSPLPAAWADPLIDLAGGSFLYLFHYCRVLHWGVYRSLDELPPPAEYYPRFFAHLEARVGSDLFEQCYARLLALLAVAREPVSLSHLTAWGLERARLLVVLHDVADLLSARRRPWDVETHFTLGHEALREYLAQDATWQTRLTAADHHLAELTLRRFGGHWNLIDPFDPVERYLLVHVLDHATDSGQASLLADISLADAALAHGNALWACREYQPAAAVYDLAVRVRDDQVHNQGRGELANELAGARTNYGVTLTELGRLAEAVVEFYQAILTLGELVETHGRGELAPDLATARVNKGVALRDLGRLPEALAEYDQAIAIRRELVETQGRGELANDLAAAWTNKGVALADLGRLAEAVAEYDQAIVIRRDLVETQGRRELADDLAAARMNKGNALAQLGRLAEAVAEYDLAIASLRELVETQGRGELANELAATRMNKGNALRDLGRLPEAVAEYDLAIVIRRELVETQGRSELANGLATARMNKGVALRDLGCLPEAVAEYDLAIAIRRELVEAQGRGELANDLATARMNKGVALRDLGCLPEAVAEYDLAIAGLRELVETQGRRELANDLATVRMNKGIALAQLGRLAEGVAEYDLAIAILRELVEAHGRGELAKDLAVVRVNKGITLAGLGRLSEALAEYEQAIVTLRELVGAHGRGELTNTLAMVRMNKGNTLQDLGRLSEAVAEYEQAIATWEGLVRHGALHHSPSLIQAFGIRFSLHTRMEEWQAAASDLIQAMQLVAALIEHEAATGVVERKIVEVLRRVQQLSAAERAQLDSALGPATETLRLWLELLSI